MSLNEKEVLGLISKAHVPIHVLKHCVRVNAVAQYLSSFFNCSILNIDNASILHDLFRVCDFPNYDHGFEISPTPLDISTWKSFKIKYPNIMHEEMAYVFLKEIDPAVAHLVRMHKFGEVFNLSSIEEKIVSYADKRVKHTEIVSLSDRFLDGWKRHKDSVLLKGFSREDTIKKEKRFLKIEEEIFSHLPIKPEELKKAVFSFMQTDKYHNWQSLI